MRSGPTKFLVICTAVVVLFFILNSLALHVVRRQYAPATATTVSLFNLSGQFQEWVGHIAAWKRLSSDNDSLRASVQRYTALEATVQSLQSENDTLRRSVGLSARFKRQVVPAGMFGISLTPSGYRSFVNKGEKDGIVSGQAVVSLEGVLLGKVHATFTSSSEVILISDPEFLVTVKVLSGTSSGILRGALQNGMNLDLITQSDEIKEGDTLVTTGNDLIPAGLVAGVVRHVENNDIQLFKKVSVNVATEIGSNGSVVIIQK